MRTVREIFVDDQHWVIRAQPSGVSLRSDLWSRGFNLGRRILRWARGDSSWVLSVRRAANNPWGAPELERRVGNRAQVPAELETLASDVCSGKVLNE